MKRIDIDDLEDKDASIFSPYDVGYVSKSEKRGDFWFRAEGYQIFLYPKTRTAYIESTSDMFIEFYVKFDGVTEIYVGDENDPHRLLIIRRFNEGELMEVFCWTKGNEEEGERDCFKIILLNDSNLQELLTSKDIKPTFNPYQPSS